MWCKQTKEFPRSCAAVNDFWSVNFLKTNHSKIWKAFVEVCEDEEWAKKSIDESNPQIQIVKKIPTADDCAAGLFQPRFGNGVLVFINSETAQLFENDGAANYYKFMAVLLHECVHYARYWADKDVVWFQNASGGIVEAGKAFELKAFGKIINPFTQAKFDQCTIENKK